MKILLPGKSDDLDNAKAWVDNSRLFPVLHDLETTLKTLELRWGPCTLFVECKFPGTPNVGARQIDLLIAFQDRAAQIEIKQGRLVLDNTVTQINKQRRLIEAHLGGVRISMDRVSSLLWTPNLSQVELNSIVRGAWVDDHFHHIVPTGGLPNLRGITLTGGGSRSTPAYLPEALVEQLQARTTANSQQSDLAKTLTTLVTESYTRTSVRVNEFIDFESVREFLRFEQPRWNKELIFDPTHLSGLRAADQANALQSMYALKFVEVIGPARFGKSTFIQELLVKLLNAQDEKYDVLSCVIARQNSVWDVLRELARESGYLEEQRIDRLAEDNLLSELAGHRLIYWIKDYDRASRASVAVLCNKLRQFAKGHRAFWVIESMVAANSKEALEPSAVGQVKLGPLDNQTLTNILKKQPVDGRYRDINAIVNDAGGNPHYAIMKWTEAESGRKLLKSIRLDQYELYQAQLNPNEVFVLKTIAYLLFQSPLEIVTVRLVEEYCRTLPSFKLNDARRLIRGVIEKAAAWGLIAVEIFGSEKAGEKGITRALADAAASVASGDSPLVTLFPTTVHEALIGWIRVLDPHFIEHYFGAIEPEEENKWRRRLDEAFLTHPPSDLSVTDVTLSLLTGHYQPFAQSSFRSSFSVIPALDRWLRTRERTQPIEERGSNEFYFTQYVKWLFDHYWDHEGGVKWKLPAPDPEEPSQVLLFDTMRARGEVYRHAGACDWGAWSKATDELWQERKYDLWAESMVRQAQTWLRPPYNDPSKAWEIMQSVLREMDKLSSQAGRSLVCFHVLSFLNKRKLTERVGSLESEAPKLVAGLAAQMIHDALGVENLNSIANALFFLVRSIEQRSQPKSSAEVDNYVSMMRFVERISPARRMQAILTQGSIHRHYGRREKLEWDDFRDHADEAIAIFERVIGSVGASGVNLQVLNALSYTGEVLLRALRFAGEEELGDWAKKNFLRGLQLLEAEMTRSHVLVVVDQNESPLDEGFRFNLVTNKAVQLWVVALTVDPSKIDELAPAFAAVVQIIQGQTKGLGRVERMKRYSRLLINFVRVFSFSAKESHHRQALGLCRNPLIDLLEEVSRVLPTDPKRRSKSGVRKDANKIIQLLSGAEIEVPAQLLMAFSDRPPLASQSSSHRPPNQGSWR